jgi:two-component system response regulator YesN
MKNDVFDKTLLKLFMILLLAISIMFVSNYYIYKSSMNAMFEQAEVNNKLVVNGIIQSFEESFKEINDIIHTVGTLPYNLYDSSGHNNINMKNAYLLMKNVNQIITQDYIHDFIIYFKNSDLVLTLSGTESFNSIFTKKYKNNNYAPEYWSNYAATRHSMKIIPSAYYEDEWSANGTTKNLLAIVASNQINYSVGNIVVFVDLTKLYAKVNENIMMPGTSLIVLDKDKNVIISTDGDYDLEGMENIFFDTSNKSTIQKGDYNYHLVRSEYNSFTYINKVPYGYESYLSTIRINKIILFMTTIVGVIISLLLSIYIHSPVKKILWLVGMKDGNKNQNHYKYIYNSIEKIQLENKLINSKMDNVREEVMRSIFFKMIDDITFYKDMKDQIDTYFKAIFFNRQFLMVGFELLSTNILKNVEDDSLEIIPDKLRKDIEIALEKIGDGNYSVVVFYKENMQLVALVGVKEQIKRSKLLNDIEGVKEQLQKTLSSYYTVLVAVSKFYTEPQNCKEAFEEIKLCFAYRTIKNTKTLIDLEKNEHSYDVYMPLSFDEKLSNYILSGNTSESINLIKQVIDTNISNNVSNIKFQYIIDNIFNNMVNILVHLNVDREELLLMEKEFRSKAKNFSDHEKINAYFENLVELTTRKVHSTNQSKVDKDLLLQYINIHYAENLYLDKMAEVFNTTPKYFSNFFKKAFGINFVEYLNKLRISHAKEMLKSSEIPVNEIGERVGYLSPSTFASTFKKYSGITPSEFRKHIRVSNVPPDLF